MDQELVQYLNQRFDEMRREMNAQSEETKRHSGVLVEGLRYELQLVAEGLATHIEVRHNQEQAYMDEKFRETNAFINLCYERIENLERKGQG